MAPIKILNITMGGNLCDDIVSERLEILKFHTSGLVSLRTWYYFRLCFSFSCSSYDLMLIKQNHTLNCYLLLQKFLVTG